MLSLLLLLSCRDKTSDTSGADETDTAPAADSGGAAPPDFACTYVDPPEHGDEGTVAITVEVVAEGLFTPWGLAWMPDGDMLLTERDGVISRVTPGGVVTQLAVVPSIETGEGGLLGLALDPDFATSRAFYIYYTASDGGTVNRVARWSLSSDGISAAEESIIVDDIPARQYHNGGRLRIGPDERLYIGTGDAGDPDASQDIDSLAGKVLRVNRDGSIPDDNPIDGSATWLWGVRNTQGFDWLDDETMVISDHGPSGLGNEGGRSDHDEVTVAVAGDNLGWPVVYACESGEGFTPASITWGSAMPPGGLAVYTGTEIPDWSGDVLIGVLGFDDDTPHLHRLRLDDVGNVTRNEVYLHRDYGRLRETIMGPDGGLYVTTSNCDGRGTCGEGDRILRVGG